MKIDTSKRYFVSCPVGSELLDARHQKFILQVEPEEFERMKANHNQITFSAKVVFSKNKFHHIGKEDCRWCSPYHDMAKWGCCCFQQVDANTVQNYLLDKW